MHRHPMAANLNWQLEMQNPRSEKGRSSLSRPKSLICMVGTAGFELAPCRRTCFHGYRNVDCSVSNYSQPHPVTQILAQQSTTDGHPALAAICRSIQMEVSAHHDFQSGVHNAYGTPPGSHHMANECAPQGICICEATRGRYLLREVPFLVKAGRPHRIEPVGKKTNFRLFAVALAPFKEASERDWYEQS